jgi:chaperonin GroEL (HSP60 family)
MGVDVNAGAAGDMAKLGIFESYKVKKQVRLSD